MGLAPLCVFHHHERNMPRLFQEEYETQMEKCHPSQTAPDNSNLEHLIHGQPSEASVTPFEISRAT